MALPASEGVLLQGRFFDRAVRTVREYHEKVGVSLLGETPTFAEGLYTNSQHVTWRSALVWSAFFSKALIASGVGSIRSSILRRFASSFTSFITGNLIHLI